MRDPATLGWVFGIDPQRGNDRARASAPDYIDYRRSLRSFSALAARAEATLTLSGRGDAERLAASAVTANLFPVWGLRPRLGRLFRIGEDAPGAEPVVVLSNQFWQRRFAGDPAIIGSALTLDGKRVSVIGVLEPAIEIGNLSEIDVWVPLVPDPAEPGRDRRELEMVGRLAPGVTVAQADAELRALAAALERDHPVTNKGWGARVAPTREAITGRNTWQVLALLSVAVGLLLLIACANLANAMLARSMDRNREISLRVALGAGRRVLVRQLLAEYAVLAAVGGALGLGVAYGGVRAIKAVVYEPFFALLSIDARVILYAIGVTLVTCVLFGLAPALRAARADPIVALAQGSARMIGGVGVRRSRAVAGRRAGDARRRADGARRAGGAEHDRADANRSRIPDRRPVDVSRRSPTVDVRGSGAAPAVLRPGDGSSVVAASCSIRGCGRPPPRARRRRGHDAHDRGSSRREAGRPAVGDPDIDVGGLFRRRPRSRSSPGECSRRPIGQDALPVVVVNRELARRYFGSVDQALGRRVSLGRTRCAGDLAGHRRRRGGYAACGHYRSAQPGAVPATRPGGGAERQLHAASARRRRARRHPFGV